MDKDKERLKRIIWIDSNNKLSGTVSNFIYDISGYIPNDAKKLTIQLKQFIIPNTLSGTTNVAFSSYYMRILADLGCATNQRIKTNSNFLLLAVIPVQTRMYYYDGVDAANYTINYQSEFNDSKHIKYDIERPQNLINIKLVNYTDSEISLDAGGTALSNCLFSVEIEYEL